MRLLNTFADWWDNWWDYRSDVRLIRALWRQARTLDHMGELTASWLEGDAPYLPGYGAAGPDPETLTLVPVLAAFNRAGYVTTGSQPGELDPADRWAQRAAVEGFCTAETMARLRRLDYTGLHVLVATPGAQRPQQETVTEYAGRPYTSFGPLPARVVRDYYGADVHPDGYDVLTSCWQVTVIDPQWGREDYLWDQVGQALGTICDCELLYPSKTRRGEAS